MNQKDILIVSTRAEIRLANIDTLSAPAVDPANVILGLLPIEELFNGYFPDQDSRYVQNQVYLYGLRHAASFWVSDLPSPEDAIRSFALASMGHVEFAIRYTQGSAKDYKAQFDKLYRAFCAGVRGELRYIPTGLHEVGCVRYAGTEPYRTVHVGADSKDQAMKLARHVLNPKDLERICYVSSVPNPDYEAMEAHWQPHEQWQTRMQEAQRGDTPSGGTIVAQRERA